MASHFQETYRALSRQMAAAAGVTSALGHPSGKGDSREDLIRNFLESRIGTTFGASKAEVVDSNGASSGELDVVVFDQSVASSLYEAGGRRIVRVEAVAATVEVKSRLDPSTWLQESERVRDGIGQLRRYYRPGPLLAALGRSTSPNMWEPTERAFYEGISPLDDFQDIPAVVSAYFGFEGPAEERMQGFIETPLLDAVCVLGKYTIAKKRVGFNKRANGSADALGYVWGRGDDALGAFLQVIETALGNVLDARALVFPAARYYAPPK